MTDLWYGTKGHPDAPIVIVGESWGAEEKAQQRPFVGVSGAELHRMLRDAGIREADVLFTNLIADQPHANETFRFFDSKNSDTVGRRIGGLIPGSLARSEVQRLYRQLAHRPRALVIAAGNWSLWGLSRCTGSEIQRDSSGRRVPVELQTYAPNGIMNWRGSMIYVEPHPELSDVTLPETKLLPIIHPAAIIRSWELRAPTMHDLNTRVRQALHNDWRRQPTPHYLYQPTFTEAKTLLHRWLNQAEHHPLMLANDIETISRRFISCMGFADSPIFALTIPFIKRKNSDGSLESYWSEAEEAEIVKLIRKILTHPKIKIVGQNYIYDTQYIQHWLGCSPALFHDTMLAQNVLFPGTPKDLGYLSSLYCDYHWYWKEDAKDYNTIDERLLRYNCEDVVRTWEIANNQLKLIDSLGQREQMDFKMQTNSLCLRMMNRGVLIDQARAGSMYCALESFQTAVYQELLEIIPQDWVQPLERKTDKPWYRSAKQTAEVFYDILGFSQINHKKTGNRTVGKEALAILERRYPEFTGLFRRLDYAGSVTNTMNVIKTPVEADGRMRCAYNPGGTETHRLSSSENVFGRGTNLQNLTKGEEDD